MKINLLLSITLLSSAIPVIGMSDQMKFIEARDEKAAAEKTRWGTMTPAEKLELEKSQVQKQVLHAMLEGKIDAMQDGMRSPLFSINFQYNQVGKRTLINILCGQDPQNSMGGHKFHKEALQLLLRQPGINVNVVDQDRWSALSSSAHNQDTTALRMLIERKNELGLDLNQHIGMQDETTALHVACQRKRVEHVKLLLSDPTVNPNIPRIHNTEHPLHQTATGCYFVEKSGVIHGFEELVIMRDLVERGAKIECLSANRTPLGLAIERLLSGRYYISGDRVPALVALGANVEQYKQAFEKMQSTIHLDGNDHESSLILNLSFFAAVEGRIIDNSLIKDFLSAQTINAQDKILGMTPVMWAAARGNVALLEQLTKANPNFLLADAFGDTALHHAARNGHANTAQFIIEHAQGVKLIKNKNNRTALEVARSAQKPALVALLNR